MESRSYSYARFRLEVGEPTVVIRGEPAEKVGWGPYQFPSLRRTRGGDILYTCVPPEGKDDILGYEGQDVPFGRVSGDGGNTWREITDADIPCGVPLPDGKEYIQPKNKNAFSAAWIEKYTPDAPATVGYGGNQTLVDLYYAEKIPEYPRDPEAYHYDPKTGKTEAFRMKINWPNLAVQVYPKREGKPIYPMEMTMGGMGHYMADPDGTLFFVTYGFGFNAVTGKPEYPYYLVTVLRSDDGGRSWEWQSEVPTPPEYVENDIYFEGFCEPCIERVTDGSVILLMRTGNNHPSYIARSTDNCKTWSKPVVFDKVGVFPQLLHLACGVTLASYGRDGLFLRATDDDAGLVWEEPIDLEVPVYGNHQCSCTGSCCYTSLLALDDTTALVAYSHFSYPNEEGVPVKTLLLRKIKVFPSEL